jgi:hypothetical protein
MGYTEYTSTGVINMKKLALILTLLSVAGCSPRTGAGAVPSVSLKAVYFIQKDAQLSSKDLQSYSEIVVVKTFEEFKQYASQKIALWIDKGAAPLNPEQEKWINEAPQAYYPIVLVGTSDTLYAFRDLLGLCCFMGPAGDDPGYDAPGFSVIQWKETHEPESPATIFLQGYHQKPTVQAILEITNDLLEGKLKATPTLPFISPAPATIVP